MAAATSPQGPGRVASDVDGSTGGAIVIERHSEGRPHRDKVLAVISPHSDDFTIFNGGLVAKLIDEGYRAFLIRVTNDEMAAPGSVARTDLANAGYPLDGEAFNTNAAQGYSGREPADSCSNNCYAHVIKSNPTLCAVSGARAISK